MIPRPSGGYREYESFPVIVVSHDCEWTKMLQSGTDDYKLGIAPLRRLSAFKDDAVVAEAPPGGLREDEDQATIIITKVIVVFEMAGPHYVVFRLNGDVAATKRLLVVEIDPDDVAPAARQ